MLIIKNKFNDYLATTNQDNLAFTLRFLDKRTSPRAKPFRLYALNDGQETEIKETQADV